MTDLPHGVLERVAGHLDALALLALRRTCRQLAALEPMRGSHVRQMHKSAAEFLVEDAVEFMVVMTHDLGLPPDLAHRLLHVWLDKRGWLDIVDPWREPDTNDPLDILEWRLRMRRDLDLGWLPAYHAVVVKVQKLRALFAAGLPRFASQLTNDERNLVTEGLDIRPEDGDPLSVLMSLHKPMEVLARWRPKPQGREPAAVEAIDSLRRKLDVILGARAAALDKFSDDLKLNEFAVVHQALDLWS